MLVTSAPKADADGLANGSDPCPVDAVNDADGDGFCGNEDGKDSRDNKWSVPSQVRGVRLAHTGGTGGTTTVSRTPRRPEVGPTRSTTS